MCAQIVLYCGKLCVVVRGRPDFLYMLTKVTKVIRSQLVVTVERCAIRSMSRLVPTSLLRLLRVSLIVRLLAHDGAA